MSSPLAVTEGHRSTGTHAPALARTLSTSPRLSARRVTLGFVLLRCGLAQNPDHGAAVPGSTGRGCSVCVELSARSSSSRASGGRAEGCDEFGGRDDRRANATVGCSVGEEIVPSGRGTASWTKTTLSTSPLRSQWNSGRMIGSGSIDSARPVSALSSATFVV